MTPDAGDCLLVAGGLLIWLGLHPFVTYPLSLSLLARLRPRPLRTGPAATSVALCVCAYNEERVIAARIENMIGLQQAGLAVELLVYVDAATDRTAALAAAFGEQIGLVVSAVRLGKTHGMNLLVGKARSEIIVFSDANVRFAPDALPRLLAPFADPEVGCVCGHLVTTSGGGETALVGSAYWRFEERLKDLESRTGSVMGADGSIFAIRRALHLAPAADLIDDMYVSLAILCSGWRIVRAADAYAWEPAVSSAGEDFARRQRIACQAFNVHRALRAPLRRLGWLDRYKYVSHKMLRWLLIYLLGAGGTALLAGCALGRDWVWLGTLVAGGTVGFAGLLLAPSGKPAALRDAAVACVATGLGVLRSLRGDRFQTWEPPGSSRRLGLSELPPAR